MLPHATIMACSKKKNDGQTLTWRKKAKIVRKKVVSAQKPDLQKKPIKNSFTINFK